MLGPYTGNCIHSYVGRHTTQMMYMCSHSAQLCINMEGWGKRRQLVVPKVPSAKQGQGSWSRLRKVAGDCQIVPKMKGLSSFARNQEPCSWRTPKASLFSTQPSLADGTHTLTSSFTSSTVLPGLFPRPLHTEGHHVSTLKQALFNTILKN